MIKPRQHSYSIVKVLNSASEMKILQYVTDLWTMNITFYKEKLNPLSSLMTGATYWCKKQTAIVLVSDRQRNAASQKLSSPMILALYFIHVWTGVSKRPTRAAHSLRMNYLMESSSKAPTWSQISHITRSQKIPPGP